MTKLMQKLRPLAIKHKETVLYLVFGGVTTAVSFAVLFVCIDLLQIEKNASNVISWVISVFVAFVTNKLFVFESKSLKPMLVIREAASFYSSRFLTFLADQGMFFAGVSILGLNPYIVKIFTNIFVIISNYFLSKLIIFRKNREESIPMNDVLNCIHTRRSIRRYKPDMPKKEELDILIEAAFASPSAKNRQPWYITVVTNRELNSAVVDGCRAFHRQNGSFTDGMAAFDNFYGAPCVFYLHAETANMKYAANDIGIMEQNICLAAQSIGLGTCIIWNVLPAFEGPDAEKLLKSLAVPDGYTPYATVAVGYAEGEIPESRGRDKTKVNWIE